MLRDLVNNLGELQDPLVIVGVALLVLLSLKPILIRRNFSEKLRHVLTAAIVTVCCLVIITGSIRYFRSTIATADSRPDQTLAQTTNEIEKKLPAAKGSSPAPEPRNMNEDHPNPLATVTVAKSLENEEEVNSSGTPTSPSLKASHSQQDARPRVAVLRCESKARGAVALADYCAGVLSTHLGRSEKIVLLDPKKVNDILEAQAFSQTGDSATAIRVGRLLGAQYLATGTIENVRKGESCVKSNAYGVSIENCTYSVSITLEVTDATTGAVVYSDTNSASQNTQKTPYLTQAEVPLHDLLDDALSPLANAAVQRLRRAPK